MAHSNRRSAATRRRFLADGAAAAAALALGPSFLAACASSSTSGSSPTAAPSEDGLDDGRPATGSLRVSNWPFYVADGFVGSFQRASGLTVDYREDFNDNEQWFAKNKEPLSRNQDIGADLVVPTEFMALRLKALGWLDEINEARVPNKKNLRPDLLNDPADPGRKYTAPYVTGMVGLAYDKTAIDRPITKIDDLWDPRLKGKVSLLSDMQDGLGMVMAAQGGNVASPTMDSIQRAVDLVREQKDKGQIRRFTGNDYADDLAAGNVVVAQAYSGDVVQLQADNPNLEFVIPESGGNWFIDTQIIPRTTRNRHAAEAWIDYVYDKANYARLVAVTQFVPVLSGMTDELAKIDPKLAANPLVNPPQEYVDRLTTWAALTDEQTQQFNTAYAAVTGG